MNLCEGTDLVRTFGDLRAVRDVTCVVPAGARIAVVGASGSGKSTLLHLIAGLDQPTSGTVTWPALAGHPLDHPGRIGIVLQKPNLLPTLDVRENVALPLLFAGADAATATAWAATVLDSLDLTDLADRLPHELSGGQAQRVAVARAIATEPDLVVADEPSAAMDTPTATALVDTLLATVDRTGAALVLATHDLRIADRLDTRWEMTQGAIAW